MAVSYFRSDVPGIRKVHTTTAGSPTPTITYRARITVDGTSFTRTFATLLEAMTWRDAVKSDPSIATQDKARRTDTTRLKGWVTEWAELAGNPNTANSRASCLDVFSSLVRPKGKGGEGDHSPKLSSLKSSHFQPWANGTDPAGRYAQSSVDTAWANLHAALNYAVDQGKLSQNPMSAIKRKRHPSADSVMAYQLPSHDQVNNLITLLTSRFHRSGCEVGVGQEERRSELRECGVSKLAIQPLKEHLSGDGLYSLARPTRS